MSHSKDSLLASLSQLGTPSLLGSLCLSHSKWLINAAEVVAPSLPHAHYTVADHKDAETK